MSNTLDLTKVPEKTPIEKIFKYIKSAKSFLLDNLVKESIIDFKETILFVYGKNAFKLPMGYYKPIKGGIYSDAGEDVVYNYRFENILTGKTIFVKEDELKNIKILDHMKGLRLSNFKERPKVEKVLKKLAEYDIKFADKIIVDGNIYMFDIKDGKLLLKSSNNEYENSDELESFFTQTKVFVKLLDEEEGKIDNNLSSEYPAKYLSVIDGIKFYISNIYTTKDGKKFVVAYSGEDNSEKVFTFENGLWKIGNNVLAGSLQKSLEKISEFDSRKREKSIPEVKNELEDIKYEDIVFDNNLLNSPKDSEKYYDEDYIKPYKSDNFDGYMEYIYEIDGKKYKILVKIEKGEKSVSINPIYIVDKEEKINANGYYTKQFKKSR